MSEIMQPERTFITQAAERLHYAVVRAKGELAQSAFALGGALARMQDEKAHTALGFAMFEDYLASPAVDIHRVTAYRFVRVFRAFQHVAHGLHGRYDIQKLDIIGKLIDPEMDPAQVEALIEEARPIPREELRARVNAVVAERAAPRAVPPPPVPFVPGQAAHRRMEENLGTLMAANPEFVQLQLLRAFAEIHSAFRKLHERDVRHLVASTPPEELARILLGDEILARSHRSNVAYYERDIKPTLAWYEEVARLLNDPPATIRRVK